MLRPYLRPVGDSNKMVYPNIETFLANLQVHLEEEMDPLEDEWIIGFVDMDDEEFADLGEHDGW